MAVSDRVASAEAELWQQTLTLVAAPGSDRAKAWRAGTPTPPRGGYSVRIDVDAGNRLAAGWRAERGPADGVGAVRAASNWKPGYAAVTAAAGAKPE